LNQLIQEIIYLKNYQLLRQSLYFKVCFLIALGVLLVSLALYNELGMYFTPRVCSFVSYVGAGKISYLSNQLLLSINVNNALSLITNELFLEMMIFTQLVKKLPNLI